MPAEYPPLHQVVHGPAGDAEVVRGFLQAEPFVHGRARAYRPVTPPNWYLQIGAYQCTLMRGGARYGESSKASGTGDRDIRTIIGTIFQGTVNRIRSGYILREVVDKLSTINFNSSDDIHAVSHFYETMLKEMRDSAGDAGEFYTPRPVVRFIVNRLAPQLGERILDPLPGLLGHAGESDEAFDPLTRPLGDRFLIV